MEQTHFHFIIWMFSLSLHSHSLSERSEYAKPLNEFIKFEESRNTNKWELSWSTLNSKPRVRALNENLAFSTKYADIETGIQNEKHYNNIIRRTKIRK